MNPFIQCLTEDHKPSVEAWLDSFINAAESFQDMELPVLKLCYLVDDYDEITNFEASKTV